MTDKLHTYKVTKSIAIISSGGWETVKVFGWVKLDASNILALLTSKAPTGSEITRLCVIYSRENDGFFNCAQGITVRRGQEASYAKLFGVKVSKAKKKTVTRKVTKAKAKSKKKASRRK